MIRRALLPLFVVLAVVAGACIASDGPTTVAAIPVDRPTSPPSTTPPSGGTAIGYVGCSNSAGAVDGYHLDGGTAMWPFIRNYGGGTVTVWANEIGTNGQHWSAFTKQQQANPSTTFWFQLCRLASENGQPIVAQAQAVIAEIRRRVPGATVYVSALNDWVAPHVCPICGLGTPADMQADADELVASGDALAGPHLAALMSYCQQGSAQCGTSSAGATPNNNQTQPDGCHPNTSGKVALGGPLLSFFG